MFCRECGKVSLDLLCRDCESDLLDRARPVPSRHGPVMLLDRDLEAAIAAFNGRPVRG